VTITRRPYFYTYSGNFTNRKRREVEFSIAIEPDAERYELHGVHCSTQTTCVLVKFPQLSGAWLTLDDFPKPIIPPAELAPGSVLKCITCLPLGKDVGRKRPRFTIQLMGTMVYVDQQDNPAMSNPPNLT
jgi:hypothetical protein